MPGFTFGSDPEFPVIHGDKFVSAVRLLPPKPAPGSQKIPNYFDNVMAEAQMEPAGSRVQAIENVRSMISRLDGAIAPRHLMCRAAHSYHKSELQTPESREAGCVPEMSAYTMDRLPLPPGVAIDEENRRYFTPRVTMRSAGGHIHLGGEKSSPLQHWIDSVQIVRMLDLFLAVPALFIDKDETNKDRRKMYGLAGSHRVTDYGIEYRPLSNFWLSSPKLVGLVYDICDFVIGFVEKKGHERFWSFDEAEDEPAEAHHCFGYDVQMLQKCINSCDKQAGEKFMVFSSTYMPVELYHSIEEAISAPQENMYQSWNL